MAFREMAPSLEEQLPQRPFWIRIVQVPGLNENFSASPWTCGIRKSAVQRLSISLRASRTRSWSSTFPVTVIRRCSGSHFAAVQEQGRNTYSTVKSPPRYRSDSFFGKRSFFRSFFFAAYCWSTVWRERMIQSSLERANFSAVSGSVCRGRTSSTSPSGGRTRKRIVRARSERRTRQSSREPSGRGRDRDAGNGLDVIFMGFLLSSIYKIQ